MTSRLDGPLKVTGRAKYGLDHNFPGMAYGYVVLSTIAHGEIEAMEVTAAKSAPGVIDVYSPFDPLALRTPSSPLLGETWVPLQDREVAYYGQPSASWSRKPTNRPGTRRCSSRSRITSGRR